MTTSTSSGTSSNGVVQLDAETRAMISAMPRPKLQQLQLDRLNQLLASVLPANAFYQRKLGESLRLQSLDELARLPLTTKEELVGGATGVQPPNLTFPLARYTRFHRTSGTKGKPLPVLDTAEDWKWWMQAWQFVLDAAEVTANDRIVSAFSFGPFIGFWSAHDAAAARGALMVPSGGMNTQARLELLKDVQATVIFCTPTYALRLAEVASEIGFDLASLPVRAIVVAGEPGGSIPVIRDRIEAAFAAKVIDHSGASEVGPWGYVNPQRTGLLINEFDFIAEFLPLEGTSTNDTNTNQEMFELVLTNLGRVGCPVIRYRTGDAVRPDIPAAGFTLLQDGIVGRADDMLIVRGVNIFPSSIEAIVREFNDIAEFRMIARKQGAMDDLVVEIEDEAGRATAVRDTLAVRLGLRVEVTAVPPGSLPRFEVKGKRFIDER